jgi:DNA-binding transcriptional regulator YhcF (GntR family)
MKDPKYRHIVRSIQEKILKGIYPPGGKLPGFVNLAKEYHVSAITSNRALTELERLGLVERRERLGTFVLDRPKALTDVLVIPQHTLQENQTQLFDYWRGIVQQGEKQKLSIQLIQANDRNCAARISPDRYRGQGLALLGSLQTELFQTLQTSGIPHVHVGVQPPASGFAVLEDRFHAAADLVRAMISDGYRRIGFVGNLEASNHRLARDGYVEGVKPLGLGFRYIRDANDPTAVEVVKDLLGEESPGVDAVIIMGSVMPIAGLPVILNYRRKIGLGVLTESSAILQLRHVAYVANYSQIETGKMAVDLLQEIAGDRLAEPVVRHPSYEILRPE